MSTWDRIKRWFRSEAADARKWSEDLQRDLSADLDRKEAHLQASPAERLENLQEQIAGNTDAFVEIKGKIAAADTEAGTDPSTDDGG
ncbi:MAG: hypothetical protein OES24_07175 [Acidimicrobiia bacterium]|nr:hypothetical protein [Acidimicrobiia bacterium]